MEHWIIFKPKGKKTQIQEQATILEAAMEIGLKLRHNCGGNSTCGTCRVQVEEGYENLSPVNQRELELLGEDRIQKKFRLACQCKVNGAATILIPHWLPLPDNPV